MKLFFRFLLDQYIFIFTFLGVAGLFAFTFFLYEVPAAAYWDAVLFAGVLLFIILGVQFGSYLSKHRRLQEGIKAAKLYAGSRSKVRSLIEEDYEQLIKTLDQDHRTAYAELEKANYQLMDYYGMWSHQIKTPLAVLDLKLQEEDLDAGILKRELFKIDQYLDMMLQYLRLNHTETDFVFGEVDLDELIRSTVKKYRTFFIYKELGFSFTPLNKTVISDRKWLQFVLEQILFNALKYTQKGQISIYANPDNIGELVIEDTGIGILPEDISRIFDKGYTGFNGRQYQKASGLGLYMSREILTKMGHGLRITSEVGRGTKVYLDLTQKIYHLE